MRVQAATGFILFSLLQLYTVILAATLPATVPSQILNSQLTPNFTTPYNVTYSATSPSNSLPPDPSHETIKSSTVVFYDYGVRISHRDTAECLAQVLRICMEHFPDFDKLVETPQKVTVGSVELHVDPKIHFTWKLLAATEHMLAMWLEKYEHRTLKFEHWYYDIGLIATGNLSRVGAD